MNAQMLSWTIEISDIATELRVGIWAHEREPQPVLISLSMRASAPAFPESIDDCLNYQPVCQWITQHWPLEPHTPLLETKVRELMAYVFNHDSRIDWVELSIHKTAAIAAAAGVGIRMALSRADYAAAFAACKPRLVALAAQACSPVVG